MRKDYFGDYVYTSTLILQSLCSGSSNVACLYTGGKDSAVLQHMMRDFECDFVFFLNSGFSNHMSISDEITLDFFEVQEFLVKCIEDTVPTGVPEWKRWQTWMIHLKQMGYRVAVCGNRWSDNLRDAWEPPPMVVCDKHTDMQVAYPLNTWTDGHVWQYISKHHISHLTH